MKRFPHPWLAAAMLVALACRTTPIVAAEAPAKDAVAIERAPEQLGQIDEELAKKLDAVRAAVETEAEAKRINEATAQGLRWSLRVTRPGGSVDVRNIVTSARVPEDNAVLVQAFRDLETASAALQAKRAALTKSCMAELRRRIAEVMRNAQKPEEAEALQTTLDALKDAVSRRPINEFDGEMQMTFSRVQGTLRGLKRLLDAQTRGDRTALGAAISQLRSTSGSYSDSLAESETQQRIEQTLKPFTTGAEESRRTLDAAILARKPAAEVSAALTNFEEASEKLDAVRGAGYGASNEERNVVGRYRTIAEAFEAIERADADSDSRLREARSAAQQLGAERSAKLAAVFAKWEQERREAAVKNWKDRCESLRGRLAAAAKPSDLEEIAAEAAKLGRESREENEMLRSDIASLPGVLLSLATAWSTASPMLLNQNRYVDSSETRSLFGKELRDLSKRIEREVLSRALKAPELVQPPLAQQPAEEAINALCKQLADKGEWRRLYQILEARDPMQMERGMRRGSDATEALRAFFAGQNFERAEQWSDAVQSYKAVMRSVSELAPIAPAADRLKALAKEHPEAASAPAASTAPRVLELLER